MRVLFVTWDGPGTRYLESLFLPIFARLRVAGIEVHVVQFGWGDAHHVHAAAAAAARARVPYVFRSIPAAHQGAGVAVATLPGALWIARYVRRAGVDVLMPRSIIPAGMAMMARAVGADARLAYDADGLMADERVDFGGWHARDARYRVLRRIERAAVRGADVVMVRTRRAGAILRERAAPSRGIRISVVSNGRDASVFRPSGDAERAALRASLGMDATAPLLVYAGSLGPQYEPERMLAFFADVHRRRPDARLLVLSSMPDDDGWLARAPSLRGAVHVRRAEPHDVAQLIAVADLGLAFRTRCLSQQAVAPIKVGEYLLCGVPVLATGGVGDLDAQIDPSIGHLVQALGDDDLRRASEWFVDRVLPERDGFRVRCRRVGVELFGLSRAVREYRDALALAARAEPRSITTAPKLAMAPSRNAI